MKPDYGRKIDLDQYTDFALLESDLQRKGWGLWSIYLLEQNEVFLFARKIREKLDRLLEIHPVPVKDHFSLIVYDADRYSLETSEGYENMHQGRAEGKIFATATTIDRGGKQEVVTYFLTSRDPDQF